MQLATIDSPEFVGWEKFFADGKKDEPPIECRLAVTLSEEGVYSFVDFQDQHFYCDAEHLGWDIRRMHGAPDGAGRDMFATLVAICGAPDECYAPTPDGGKEYDSSHCDRLWESFDRDQVATDRLLIDGMDDAIHEGWEATPDIAAVIETLRDMQEARGAQRKATEKAEETERDARVQAEIDAEFATYEKWIADREPASDPLAADHAERKRRIQQAQFARDIKSGKIPMPVLPFPTPAVPLPDLLTSSAEFVGGFVPPEYLIDGILQRRYFYSLTAQTGVGKTAIAMRWAAHVVSGAQLGAAEVEKGAVLYMAGENPTDVQARWLGLSRAMGIDPAAADMHFLVGAMDISQVANRILAEVIEKKLHLALVVVDTAAAYNFGDDENNNTQMGHYARQLRTLTNLPGGPCVVVLCHPTKRAGDDDLMPRGGSAFIAEVDGNMAVQKKDGVLTVIPQIKFRGSQEWRLPYELEVIRDHPVLKDVKGRTIPTVIAKPVAAGVAAVMETRSDRDTEMVLAAVHATPAATPAALARALGWVYGAKSEPNVNKVKRNLGRLAGEKLVVERLGTWRATPLGEKELNAIDTRRAAILASPPCAPVTLN
jgi:hypothetical protein